MRPRYLYFWLFAWFASQGRFTSLFLKDIGISETNIGLLFSMRSLISLFITPPIALFADKIVSNGNKNGYEFVVGILSILSTIFFLFHGLAQISQFSFLFNNIYYIFFIRILYSITTSPIYSIIDGIALKYLTDNGEGKENYGKERMYGAISWAIVSFILGIAIDYYSPKIMYLFMIITLIPLLICIWLISKSNSIKTTKITNSLKLRKKVDNNCEEEYELIENPLNHDENDNDNGGDGGDNDDNTNNNKNSIEIKLSTLPQSEDEIALLNSSIDDQDENDENDNNDDDVDKESDDYVIPSSSTSSNTSNTSNSKGTILGSNYLYQLLIILSLFFSSLSGILFIFLILILRMGTSIVENLIFLFFTNELGSSNFICGLSVVVTVLFEIPIFHYSSYFLKTLNRNGLMILACLSYSSRVIGYTLLSSPWYILLLEPLHGVTYGFSTIASVDYVAGMVSSDLQATGQGLLGSLQTGIGTLIGVGLGGYIEEKYGSIVLYRSSGIIVAIMLFIYIIGVIWEKKSIDDLKKNINSKNRNIV